MYDLRDQNIGLAFVITLFLLPVLIETFRKNLFRQFSFPTLIRVFNWAFVIQLICGVILFIVVSIIDRNDPFLKDNFHAGDKVNHFNLILFGVQWVFSVVGLFMYLPALIILNTVYWTVLKFKNLRS